MFLYILCLMLGFSVTGGVIIHADLLSSLKRLEVAYPDSITSVSEQVIVWRDGTRMPVCQFPVLQEANSKRDNTTLADQIEYVLYKPGKPEDTVAYAPHNDPGRVRCEPFFRKMYGDSPEDVERNLIEIAWMPNVFGNKKYLLKVTTINQVHEKLQNISRELEELVSRKPELCIFLDKPGGTYCWRTIANSNRLSAHSFGMTIDINSAQSNYWQWDLIKKGCAITESAELIYHNHLPWDIVLIFEKYGFIWGGKWYHYDTMHFEYRPELLLPLE